MKNDEYKIMYDLEDSYWWFIGKQVLVKKTLQSFLSKGLKRDAKILDIGSGTGIVLRIIEDFGVPVGMEVSLEAIHFLKKRNLKYIVCSDADTAVPFKNDTFGVTTCLDVLEHVDNDNALLKEMLRVCKPGGHVLITVPAFNALWSPHDMALYHKRRYTYTRMVNKIRKLNFTIIRASYYNTLLCLPIFLVRKLNPLFRGAENAHSDFFLSLPSWVNKILALIFIFEIKCLRFFNFPFGVSLMLILKKPVLAEKH